jgi:methionine-rich copper-binding protein CopC
MNKRKNKMNKLLRILPLTVLGLVSFAPTASAHSHVVMTVPAAESQVKSAPKMIMLHFSEQVEPQFSKIEVTEAKSNTRVDTGKTFAPTEDPTMLHIALKSPLAPGKYHVSWKAVSADTHKAKGEYNFSYNPSDTQ